MLATQCNFTATQKRRLLKGFAEREVLFVLRERVE